MTRHALVTGATGFLGLHLVEVLLDRQWRVSALCRSTSNTQRLRALGVEIIPGDILDRPSIAAAVVPEISTIFHCAADLSVWKSKDDAQTRVNVAGTANVMSAALDAHRPRVIHVSTIAAFGDQRVPIHERTQSNAGESWINYERSKWLAEQQVRLAASHGLPAMIVSPAAVIGPRDRVGWAKLLVDLSHGRVPFCPPGSATFNDVRAVAAALVSCADKGRGGESYLLSGEALTFTEFIKLAARQIGVAAPRLTVPGAIMRTLAAATDWWETRRGTEPAMTREMATLLCRNTICGSRKAEVELGYRPLPLSQALSDSVNWLRLEGLLA